MSPFIHRAYFTSKLALDLMNKGKKKKNISKRKGWGYVLTDYMEND